MHLYCQGGLWDSPHASRRKLLVPLDPTSLSWKVVVENTSPSSLTHTPPTPVYPVYQLPPLFQRSATPLWLNPGVISTLFTNYLRWSSPHRYAPGLPPASPSYISLKSNNYNFTSLTGHFSHWLSPWLSRISMVALMFHCCCCENLRTLSGPRELSA